MQVQETLRWLILDHFRDYDKWPWLHVNSPERQYEEHPSFVIAEVLFISLAALSLLHALFARDPGGSRRLKLTWISTILVGTLNDYIFMVLPIVDNFWQAQAVIMLTPRMPLYIPCVYISFMYWPAVAAARVFNHRCKCRLAEACLGGLLAGLFYAPYDVCGARFLWWTWHDSDPAIKLRWLGVPAGSSAWTVTFNFSLCFLLRTGADRGYGQLRSLALASLSTPLMIVVLNFFTALGVDSFGVPGVRTLGSALLVFGGIVLHGLLRPRESASPSPRLQYAEPRVIRVALVAYFVVLVFIMATFSPETQISTGAHQEFGPCSVTDLDLMGYPRQRYACRQKYPEFYYSYECQASAPGTRGRWRRLSPEEAVGESPTGIASWYTICGRPHASWALWMAAVGGLAAAGVVVFPWALSARGSAETEASCASGQETAAASTASGNGLRSRTAASEAACD